MAEPSRLGQAGELSFSWGNVNCLTWEPGSAGVSPASSPSVVNFNAGETPALPGLESRLFCCVAVFERQFCNAGFVHFTQTLRDHAVVLFLRCGRERQGEQLGLARCSG